MMSTLFHSPSIFRATCNFQHHIRKKGNKVENIVSMFTNHSNISFSECNLGLKMLNRLHPRLVPFTTLVKLDPITAKYIQRTSNSQIYFSATQTLDQFQVLQIATASCIGNGNIRPSREFADQLLVNALLKTFVVGCVDQELRAVGLEEGDGFYVS